MIPAFPARRHADEFDRLVESIRTGGEAPSQTPAQLRELAALASSLSQVPAPQPRAAFSADLRERLMAAAATELKPAAATQAGAQVRDRLTVRGLSGPEPKQRKQRRLTVAIASLALIGGTAGTALASQNALPGDSLYAVKRAIENIQTGLSQGDHSKGETLIADANTRLSEVGKLSARRQASTAPEISSTLTAFAQQAQHASTLLLADYQAHHDPASIAQLHQFTKQSIAELTQMSANLPPAVQSALSQATQTLLSIDREAKQLCPTCGALGITQLPSSLLTAAGQAVHQVTGASAGKSTATSGTAGSGTTNAAKGAGQPTIKLPQINVGALPPATVPNLIPGSVLPGSVLPIGGGSPTAAAPSSAAKKHRGATSRGTSTKSPSSAPTSLGGTVNKVTSGVGNLVGGVVKGLLGGGG